MWNQIKKVAMEKMAQDPADAAFNGAICIDMAAEALKNGDYKQAKVEVQKAYDSVDNIIKEAKEAYGIDWLDSLSFHGVKQEDIMKNTFKDIMKKCDEEYEPVEELMIKLMDVKGYMKEWEGKVIGYGRSKHEKKASNSCPICGGKVVKTCRCKLSESECENGHQWHRCGVHGNIVIGEREDKLPMDVCTCEKQLREI